ncbi:MAG TPA: HAD-IA family hydrolase [Acidobacteriaceae bacterium]|jgi:putative hydrolase of the HAD superfamily
MDGISTILWDIGGVLLTNAWDRQQRDAVLTHFGLDHADFEHRHAEVDQAWEKDEIGVDEYLRYTVFFQPRTFTQPEFLDAMRTQSQVLEDSAIGILRRFSASEQYVLATVNNESRAMNEFRLAKFNLLDDFGAFFSSCYLGLRKPDRKIYQVALDVVQRDPELVAFIDDRPENVAAAVSLGIHGIQYQGSAQLTGELAKLGITVPQDRFRGLKVQGA